MSECDVTQGQSAMWHSVRVQCDTISECDVTQCQSAM